MSERKHSCGNPDKDYCVRREDTFHMAVGMVIGHPETASCMFCGRKIKIIDQTENSMKIRTVGELTRELSKYPFDTQVLVHIEGTGCSSLPIKGVYFFEPYEGAEGDMKPGFITIDGDPYRSE